MLTAVQFTIGKIWNQNRWSLTDDGIKKTWYRHMMEYYSAEKRTVFNLSFAAK